MKILILLFIYSSVLYSLGDKDGCWSGYMEGRRCVKFVEGHFSGSGEYREFHATWENICIARIVVNICNKQKNASWECGELGIRANKKARWSTYNATGESEARKLRGSINPMSDWLCASKYENGVDIEAENKAKNIKKAEGLISRAETEIFNKNYDKAEEFLKSAKKIDYSDRKITRKIKKLRNSKKKQKEDSSSKSVLNSKKRSNSNSGLSVSFDDEKSNSASTKNSKVSFDDSSDTGNSYSNNNSDKPISSGTRAKASILMLIDVSGSMSGSKLSSAKKAAISSIKTSLRQGVEIAVLAFSGDCSNPIAKRINFTKNKTSLINFVNSLSAGGGTPLGSALKIANKYMKRGKSSNSDTQMILLLADGDGGCGDVSDIMDDLRNMGIIFRHETVALEVDSSSEAANQLKTIARKSGGGYHYASNHKQLKKIFYEALDTMEILNMIGSFGASKHKTRKKKRRKRNIDASQSILDSF